MTVRIPEDVFQQVAEAIDPDDAEDMATENALFRLTVRQSYVRGYRAGRESMNNAGTFDEGSQGESGNTPTGSVQSISGV